jgi:hypothetical protein
MQFRGREALTIFTPKAESTSAKAGDSNLARSDTARSEHDLKTHPVLRLQQTIGNQAVLRMMRAHADGKAARAPRIRITEKMTAGVARATEAELAQARADLAQATAELGALLREEGGLKDIVRGSLSRSRIEPDPNKPAKGALMGPLRLESTGAASLSCVVEATALAALPKQHVVRIGRAVHNIPQNKRVPAVAMQAAQKVTGCEWSGCHSQTTVSRSEQR